MGHVAQRAVTTTQHPPHDVTQLPDEPTLGVVDAHQAFDPTVGVHEREASGGERPDLCANRRAMSGSSSGSALGGLLAGLRVLDLSIWRPGPYATQLLAELGADVLKIEPPGGDPMRSYPSLFASLNANKRSIILDLKDPSDRRRALALAAAADVLIEGFRPGVVDRLGVGYAEVAAVNPSIIYCSVSGMGQIGALAQVSGHDLNYQAWSGALAPDGGPPVVAAVPVADLAGGMAAALGICAAVVHRARTGEGERIDLAMADVLATWTGAVKPHAEGTDPSIRGVPGYGIFETADGHQVALGVLTEDHFWRPLCDAVGLADVGDLDFGARMARLAELQEKLAVAIRQRDRQALVEDLLAAGIPIAPVLDREGMLEQPHFGERSVVTADPWSDPAIGYPIRFEHHPARRDSPPPELDEHRGAQFLPR
jgi:crotonobetainyl-CoA:carnitine CoA-transferase CaiB-like acyl-CoA transferase